ncbi:MAG: histidine kinase [Christensenellaceae bacterium]|nr:histidine kinase [Christensenellaceae bacterium]
MHCRFGIYKKLALILLFTVVLPFLICSYWLFSLQADLLNHFMLLSAQREIVQMAERMNFEFSQLQSVSNLIYLNQEITRVLNADLPRPEKNSKLNQLTQGYSAGTSNLFFRILLIDRTGGTYGSALQLNHYPVLDVAGKAWNNRLDAQYTLSVWTTDSQLDAVFSNADLPGVYLIRALHDLTTHERVGTMIIGLSEKEINKKYMGYLSDYQNGYVLEEDGGILSQVVNEPMITLPSDLSKFSDVYLSEGTLPRQVVSYYTIRLNQWKFLVVSDYAKMTQPFSARLQLFAVVLAAFFSLIVSLMYVFTRRLVAPIKKLHAGMSQVGEGNLSVRVPVTSRDEIGELTGQFNGMLDRIGKLMEDVVSEQSKKRDAEVKALKAQIHPHFLYNSLASVRCLVMSGEKREADQALVSLVQILESMLGDSRETIPLEQEMSLLRDYIHLQQITFPTPFTVEEKVDEDVKNALILKLLLQPLVENAILHGLKPSRKPDKRLSLTAQREKDRLVIHVADNGVGFTPGEPIADPELHALVHSGVGVQNVRERILYTYGSSFGLTVHSAPGHGTKVTVSLPFVEKEEAYVAYQNPDSDR